MEPIERPPAEARRNRGRLSSTIVATGAAAALTLAGLGMAGAQTGSSSTTTPELSAPAAHAHAGKPPEGARRPGPRKGHHLRVRKVLATAARTIGISRSELKTALRSGQSIADVARSKNVEVQKVIDALVAEAKRHLAGKVAAGQLTQAQADRRSARLTERITALVNHARQGTRRAGEPRRGFRGPGPRGAAPAPAPAATTGRL